MECAGVARLLVPVNSRDPLVSASHGLGLLLCRYSPTEHAQ